MATTNIFQCWAKFPKPENLKTEQPNQSFLLTAAKLAGLFSNGEFMKQHKNALYTTLAITALSAAILFPELSLAAQDPFTKIEAKGDRGIEWVTDWLIPALSILGLLSVGTMYMFQKGNVTILKNIGVGLTILLFGDIIISFVRG